MLLGIPLAVPIFILYFFLSFIPFLGAWITGAFAVLIALGTGGPSAALIIGITFIISNGTIQSAVNSWALGSSLRLHPVAVLLATMIGGTVAGLLGMVIGAPVLAACVKSIAAIRARNMFGGWRCSTAMARRRTGSAPMPSSVWPSRPACRRRAMR